MTPSELISVHHVRETGVVADLHLYCGRPGSVQRTDLVNAGLGNPHPVGRLCPLCEKVHAQGEAAAAYTDQLDTPHVAARISRIAERLVEGKSIALFCFCHPKPCHCDVIRRRALEILHNDGSASTEQYVWDLLTTPQP